MKYRMKTRGGVICVMSEPVLANGNLRILAYKEQDKSKELFWVNITNLNGKHVV